MPLTDEGYSAPRATDLIAEIRADFEDETGLKPVWDRDTFAGPITALMGLKLGDLYQVAQAIYDARDPNNAAGVQLSSLGLATGVPRHDAEYSLVTERWTGTPGTEITAGSLVEGGGANDRARWEVLEDAVVGEDGTVDVLMQCTEPGAVSAGAGEIDTLITSIFGISSVTNPEAATPGIDRELDGDFRARRQASLQIAGSSSTAAIRAAVLAVDGVQACVVVANNDAVEREIEGLTMAKNSVAVVVHPDTLTEEQGDALVRAIFSRVTAGTKMIGDQVRQVVDASGVPQEVRWSFALERAYTVTVQVEMEEGGPGRPVPPAFEDVEPDIVEALEAYGAGLGLGYHVRKLPQLAAIEPIEGVRSVVSLTLALSPADVTRIDAAGNIRLLATEIGRIDPADIVVTEA